MEMNKFRLNTSEYPWNIQGMIRFAEIGRGFPIVMNWSTVVFLAFNNFYSNISNSAEPDQKSLWSGSTLFEILYKNTDTPVSGMKWVKVTILNTYALTILFL